MSGLTPEQLLQRRSWVGASESPCLLGVSPHGNAHSVWAEKLGLVVDEPTVQQDAGNWIEPALAKWYAHETGYTTASFGSVAHARYPFMGCTPDLAIFGERRIAQIKLVGMWMAHHWEDDVPEYVQIQVQHEMEVCDVDVCDVVALIGGTDFRILPIERDRELGGYLVQICHDFMHKYVVPRELPPVDGSNHASAAIKARYARDMSGIILPTEETDRLARAWLSVDARFGELEDERKKLTNQLKAVLGDAQGVDGDSYRIRWKTNAAGARPFTCKPIALRKARAA